MHLFLSKISSKIATHLVIARHIEQSEKELYIYGLETMLMYLVNFTSTLILAVFMKQAWEYIVFLFSFMPLRSNSGGYHATTPLRCYLLSTGMVVFVLMAVRYLPAQPMEWGVQLLLVFAMIVFVLAPIETPNKPLDIKEKRIYRYRARIILLREVALCMLCYVFSLSVIFWLIVLVIMSVGITLAFGLLVAMR